jgi:biotin carboxylase
LTVGTDASMTVAAVANALDLPGIKFSDAEAASNKLKMRARFREHGVPIPAFFECWTVDEALAHFRELACPAVIKPADNMGARGVSLATTEDAVRRAFTFAKAATPSGEVIIEEYMEGLELSIDALVYRGEIHITGIADRIIDAPPYFAETGHIMPSALPAAQLDDAVNVMRARIKALWGSPWGRPRADIKVTPQGAKVGEIAARLSGGFMSAYTYPYATGVDLIGNAVRIALGLARRTLAPRA